MKQNKLLALLLALAMVLSLIGCGASGEKADSAEEPSETPETAEPQPEEEPAAEPEASEVTAAGTQQVVIEGFDWGPAVTKTILTLDQTVASDSVAPECFSVAENKETFNWAALGDETLDPTQHVTMEVPRAITAAYTCDAAGNPVSDASNMIALELGYNPNEGSPYCYDLFTGKNTACNPYELTVTLAGGSTLATGDGATVTGLDVEASIDLSSALVPQLEGVDLSGTFTGSDGKTLTYGSYAPAEDGAQHPLVIWLHGAGEGGTDPSIPLLGNKVTALYSEEFQSVMGGAYVLTPQTEQFWLCYNENGDWADNPGTDSIYLSTLKELIDSYVAANPGIDANRIYVGGCSNGGYMTMDLILNYPDYFAAAFPICEAYLNDGITDAQLEGIKDLPVWFVYAQNDEVVPPDSYEIPTIQRLQELGADVHTSIFEDVHDTTGLYTGEDGAPYQYIGHWSWLYFFNNQCEENGVSLWQWLAEQSR
ncbi:MAG: prolyl oligopeptidase family serine peptidase [Candidatus Onthomonas sp.]